MHFGDISEYYWDTANATKMGKYLTRKEMDFMDFCLDANVECFRVLDVGAGSGRFAVSLHEKGFNVFALDYDLVPLRKLREKDKDIPLVLADGSNLPFKDSTLGYVLAIEIMEYLSSLFLKECYRVLKPQGILFITASNKNSYKTPMRFLIRRREKEFYRVSYKEYIRNLYQYGFTIQKSWGFNWPPFTRVSNNRLLPIFSFIEGLLKLELFPSVSPWFFIIAKKSGE